MFGDWIKKIGLMFAGLLLAACASQPAATATTAPATVTIAAAPSPRPTATNLPAATATEAAAPATGEAAPTAELPALDELPPGLLLALENGDGGWGLWLVEEDGGLRRLLQELAAPTYRPEFQMSPDGRQMLYAYEGDIWRLDVASGETENVTQTEDRLESTPRWLPGNTQQFVAGSFTVAEAGPSPGYLTLIGFDGSYELLDEEASMSAPPAPAPDGNSVAYSRGQPFLYHLQGPESGPRRLELAAFGLEWAEKAGEAAWSPDGSRLAWTLLGSPDGSHQAQIVVLDLAAGSYQELMRYTPAGIGGMPPAPLWSADGEELLAAPLSFEPQSRGLWLFDLHGVKRRLTERPPRLSLTPNPALSPDGRRLAFSTDTFDAVAVLHNGEWQLRYWQPPERVAAVGWATLERAAAGVVTPPAEAVGALLPYKPTGGVPANVAAWAWLDVPEVGLALPLPPAWPVREWPTDGSHLLYSASIQPPLWAEPAECGYQCPEIAVAVWRPPPAESLQAWLARHGTSAPFGSEAAEGEDEIFFTGVAQVEQTGVGELPALGFLHEAMGLRSYSVVFEREGMVVSLRKSHVDQFEFEPVFEFMLRHVRNGQ